MTTLRTVKGSSLTNDEGDLNKAEKVNQAAHGFAVGDCVKLSGTWSDAQADAEANLCMAMIYNVIDTDNFWVVTQHGRKVPFTHGTGGAAGDALYLSQGTPGAVTTTKPTTGYRQQVGWILDANNVIFKLEAWSFV